MGSTQSKVPKRKERIKKNGKPTTKQNGGKSTKSSEKSSHTNANSSARLEEKCRGQDPADLKVSKNGNIKANMNEPKHGSDNSKSEQTPRSKEAVKTNEKDRNGGMKSSNHRKEEASGKLESQENQGTKVKRLSQRKRKELVEREKKKQRVTKEQLRSLSCNLRKTSWYLGKCLGMDSGSIRKHEANYVTEHEKKYQVLLWWRRSKGWKATVQQLVMTLELVGYEYDEYKSILTSSSANSGDVVIYEKALDMKSTGEDKNSKRELYHKDDYDKTTVKGGRHYGNMNYDDILPNQVQRLSQSSSSTQPRRRPRWRKPSDNIISQSENEEERGEEQRDREEGNKIEDTEKLKISSGIESNNQTHASTDVASSSDSNEIVVSDASGGKRGNTLIVRRCSDSSVKLSYSSRFKDRMEAVKKADMPIIEHDSAEQNNNKDDDTKGKGDNGDIIEEGYKDDIRSMIAKYESLTRSNKGRDNESVVVQSRTTSTLPRNYKALNHKTRHPSSEMSFGSHDIMNGYSERHSDITIPQHRMFQFGGRGKFPSRFKGMISGLDVFPNGDIVTSDSDNKRIQIFNSTGKFRTTFDTETELKPKGVCVTPENNIAVCCGDQVHVYGRDGEKVLSFGQGIFRNNCYSVCADAMSNYYVTDIVSHTVSIHDDHGRIRKRFGFQGDGMINFNQPVSLSINSKNKLFITDSQNHCIKVYSLAGRPLFRIGSKGSANGLFWNPLGLCLDHRDHLYVADCGNNRISEFDPIGNFIRHAATEDNGLNMPSHVKITNETNMVVCEWDKQYIKIFSLETEV